MDFIKTSIDISLKHVHTKTSATLYSVTLVYISQTSNQQKPIHNKGFLIFLIYYLLLV